MLHCTRATLVALSLVIIGAGGGSAGELADFNAAVEQASVPLRGALDQLAAGDANAARTQAEQAADRWSELVDRFGTQRPDAFDGNTLYASTLTDVGTRIANALTLIKSRKLDAARTTLAAIRGELSQMRRASDIAVLADCILAAHMALDALAAYKDKPPEWSKSDVRFDVAAKATIYRYELQRCDGMAPDSLRPDPQFRRLIDGALAGLALVPTAITTRDSELLGRIVTELRSFDAQLMSRYS